VTMPDWGMMSRAERDAALPRALIAAVNIEIPLGALFRGVRDVEMRGMRRTRR